MDVLVSIFAVVFSLGCFIAIFMASRKDKKKENQSKE
jgi:flagellar basal body-associated protein FliL